MFDFTRFKLHAVIMYCIFIYNVTNERNFQTKTIFAKKDIFCGITMIIEYLSTDTLTLKRNVKLDSND